jgi:hypothetical protein
MKSECGREVTRIIHRCGMSGCAYEYDPYTEWVFDVPYDERKREDGPKPMLRYGIGTCVMNSHTECGNCWNGTYTDLRPVPEPKPFKQNLCLPET